MRKNFIIYICFLVILLLGCTNPNNGEIIDIEVPKEEKDLYTKLFSSDDISIYIDIASEELELMEKDFQKYSDIGSKSPIYRKCNLEITIDGEIYKIDEVGIRQKGNTSRVSFYDNNGINNSIHFKLSFSETFDNVNYYENPQIWEKEARDIRKNRTFADLEKIDLKWNRCFDATHVREIYSYEVFRKFGLLAPHANLCKLIINNLNKKENLGVYSIIEPVDKKFIEKNFDEVGDLYKVGWGEIDNNWYGGSLNISTLDGIGIEDEDKGYFPIYDLKTNKKISKNENLINLIENMSKNNIDLIDVDYLLKFMAVSFILGNPDDYRAHYNNYYIYFNKNKAIFIPYDYDRCLGITNGWNPSKNAMTKYDSCSLYTTELDVNENPIVRYVLSNQDLKDRYVQLLNDFVNDDFFSLNEFNTYYNKYKSSYNKYCKSTIKVLENDYIGFAINESDDYTKTEVNYSIENYFRDIKKNINKGNNNG